MVFGLPRPGPCWESVAQTGRFHESQMTARIETLCGFASATMRVAVDTPPSAIISRLELRRRGARRRPCAGVHVFASGARAATHRKLNAARERRRSVGGAVLAMRGRRAERGERAGT